MGGERERKLPGRGGGTKELTSGPVIWGRGEELNDPGRGVCEFAEEFDGVSSVACAPSPPLDVGPFATSDTGFYFFK